MTNNLNTPMHQLMNIDNGTMSGNSLNIHANIHGTRSHADEIGLDPNFRRESAQRRTMLSVERRYQEEKKEKLLKVKLDKQSNLKKMIKVTHSRD